MATPAFRSAGTAAQNGPSGVTTVTASYTLTAGDLLLCAVEAAHASINPNVTAVWNGSENMTLIGAGWTTATRNVHLFGLMGGTSGTHDVVATADVSCILMASCVYGYQDVATGTPWDTAGTPTGLNPGTSWSMSATGGGTGDLVIGVFLSAEDYTSLSMTAGTSRNTQATANVGLHLFDVGAASGSTTLSGTFGNNTVGAGIAVNLNGTAAGVVAPSLLRPAAVRRASNY